MKKSAVIVTLAATALITASASPALAADKTRSAFSLPAKSSWLTPSRFAAPAKISTPTRFTAPATIAPAAALTSSAVLDRPSFNNGRFGGGLSTLFGFFPPRLQQLIANALGNSGPGAQQLCRLLGIPECQLPDSNG